MYTFMGWGCGLTCGSLGVGGTCESLRVECVGYTCDNSDGRCVNCTCESLAGSGVRRNCWCGSCPDRGSWCRGWG